MTRWVKAAVIALVAVMSVSSALGSRTAASRKLLIVDRSNPSCVDKGGSGSTTRPFCSITEAATWASAGQTVQVAAGRYPNIVSVLHSGTPTAPIVFTSAPGAVVTVSGQVNGFRIWGKKWITIKGFVVTKSSDYGISVQNSSHVKLVDNHISYTGRPAQGQARSGISFSSVSDSLIVGNTVDHATLYGINLAAGSTRNLVRGNVSFGNATRYERTASGIRLFQSPGNVVSSNVCYDNEDSGIEAEQSSGAIIADNVVFKNRDHGIDNFNSVDPKITANTVYDNLTSGINVEASSTGATITGNVSIDNAIRGPRNRSNIRVEIGSTVGSTMDYDQVYLSSPDVLLIWDNVKYYTLADFQTATGQESHGIEAAPTWLKCELHARKTESVEQDFQVVRANTCGMIQAARR